MSVRTIRPQPVVVAVAIVAASSVASAQFSLTLFHHSDAESAIVSAPSQPEYGGAARFKSKLDQLRAAAGANVLTVSNGDMFLAGPQLDATHSNPAAPFYDALAQDVSPQKLKEILEHSVANVGGGQFGHWSGLRFSYDPRLPAGQRVVDVVLESAGAGDADLLIIDEGQVVLGSPAIDLATIDFLTLGGDGYPLTDLQFTRFGVSYAQALENFITASPTSIFGGLAGLDGLINATNYPFTPLDNPLAFDSLRRIDAVPEPTAAGAMAVGAALLARRRRRGGW